jgi:hypothetical protein
LAQVAARWGSVERGPQYCDKVTILLTNGNKSRIA